MPVIIDNDLPAASVLRSEGLTVLPAGTTPQARVALVNLMPVKTDTELDFLRLIAPWTHNAEITLITMASHTSRHTPAEHIEKHYLTPAQTDICAFDGVIITGAPLEFVRFEDVDYWPEITGIFDRLHDSQTYTLYICWAAFAGLYHRYGIPMRLLDRKISGVFSHRITDSAAPLLRGITDGFHIPHSRFASWHSSDVECHSAAIHPASTSDEAGIYMVTDNSYRDFYITGHGEYSTLTLDGEYRRDIGKGMSPAIPSHYYPHDNPELRPADTWHSHAVTIMCNWLDQITSAKKLT